MAAEECRVRFAPSPSGYLHIGNARTALFNWLFARHHRGRFILRIEDTDQKRVADQFIAGLLEDLKWLGLNWDEGPEKEGEFGPYLQSRRVAIYDGFLKRFIKEGKAYPCYCTEEELEAERNSLIARKLPPRYRGKCRALSPSERERLAAQGRPAAYRFPIGGGQVEFNDLIRGPMRFDGGALGDFIIVRSSGSPAYNFAVVIDDHLMKISHVIRGEDHLSNTAAQLFLYRALGFRPPLFAHHSLMLGKDQGKLSKRHGAVSVGEFRRLGFLPESLVNYLALVGGSLASRGEITSAAELAGIFSLEKSGRAGAVFDLEKLKWLNGIYLRNDDPKRLDERLMPFIESAGFNLSGLGEGKRLRIILALRKNLTTLREAALYLPLFLPGEVPLSPEARTALAGEEGQTVVLHLKEALEENDFEGEALYRKLLAGVQDKTGLAGRRLFLPIRAALTGEVRGPELEDLFAVLEKKTLKERIEKALQAAKP